MAKIKLSRPHNGKKAGDAIEIKSHEMAFYRGMGLIAKPDKKVSQQNVTQLETKEEKPQIRPSK